MFAEGDQRAKCNDGSAIRWSYGSFVGHRVIELAILRHATKSHERFNAGE